jgi:hypothetical protein
LLDTSAPARYQEFEPEPQPRIRPFSVPWRRPLAGPLPPKSSISRAQPIPSKTICGMCASQTSGTELLTNPRCQWRPQVVCFVAGTAREFLGPARYKSGLARSTNLCYRPPLWSMRLHLRCLEKTGPHHLLSSLVAPPHPNQIIASAVSSPPCCVTATSFLVQKLLWPLLLLPPPLFVCASSR